MQKNKIFDSILTISYSLAIASLLYIAWPNLLGVILSLIVIALGIFSCFTERIFKIPSRFIVLHMTLLLNIFLLLSGSYLFFIIGGKLRPFYILIALSAALGIIFWIIGKRYAGKKMKQIILDECHLLPPPIELIIVALTIVDCIINKTFATSTLIITLVWLIDAMSQYILIKKSKRLRDTVG